LGYPNNHFDQQIAFADEPLTTLDEIGDISAFKSYRGQIWLPNPGPIEYRVNILTAKVEKGCAKDNLSKVIGAIQLLLLE